MYEDYGYNYDNGYEGYGVGYLPSKPYKPLRATKRNVEEEISYMLNMPINEIKFIKLDALPEDTSNWRHSCYQSGVTKMSVGVYPFEDGSTIYVAICPFFPDCCTVEYFIDQGYNTNGYGANSFY